MKISKVGGLIAAASKKAAQPLLQIGSIPIIKRIVISFQQAGIFPIVIVTGSEEREVIYQMASFGIIFLHNENNEEPELYDSLRLGISFLEDKCDRIAFTPVNVPMFSPATLSRLLASEGTLISPSYRNKGGHPVVFSTTLVPSMLSYSGANGLKGYMDEQREQRTWVEVEDEGILTSIHDEQQLHRNLEKHNRALLHPVVDILIEKERPFFTPRGKLLLFLISDTNSVRKACDLSAISYGTAWKMINRLEKELGFAVVKRHQGGYRGGNTDLTEKGTEFLVAYQRLQERVYRYTAGQFRTLFSEDGLT